jgi:hypothetical protein
MQQAERAREKAQQELNTAEENFTDPKGPK